MPLDDLLQRADELLCPALAVEAEQGGQQVGVALPAHQVMEQDAFLQWRERVDVFYVAGATRHCRCDAVDFRLAELDQRQHVRRNDAALRRDAVGGDDDVDPLFLQRGGDAGNCRVGEQAADVAAQAGLPLFLDQFDGQ